MSGPGEALKHVFEDTLLDLKGVDVFIYQNWQSEQMSSIEARAMKERGKQYFEFPLGTRVNKDDVVQIKGSQDFWRVLDTEEEYKFGIAVKLHVRVVKIDHLGNEIRLNSEGRAVYYTVNVHGDNRANIQQGGQGNVQTTNITNNTSFVKAIRELTEVIDNSSLTPVNKIESQSDIQALQRLGELEQTPEVKEAAKSRIESIEKTISLTADMVSLGMPIIMFIRAFF
jgi:hypothetical protein